MTNTDLIRQWERVLSFPPSPISYLIIGPNASCLFPRFQNSNNTIWWPFDNLPKDSVVSTEAIISDKVAHGLGGRIFHPLPYYIIRPKIELSTLYCYRKGEASSLPVHQVLRSTAECTRPLSESSIILCS